MSVFFQQVIFEIPAFLKDVPEIIPCYKPIGYRHMCRFQAKLVYEQPIIKELDYYWRLDDDSLLREHVTYDVFKFMQGHDYVYGYRVVLPDNPLCIAGLRQAALEFATNHKDKVNMTALTAWPEGNVYYNNFEISKVSFWLQENYREFIDFIDRKGGIYYTRWGDAPIKSTAIAMLLPSEKIYYFKDICYKHQKFDECVPESKKQRLRNQDSNFSIR
eukprot:Filipodium_phascolosomae@DN2664_c0_g1_i1.p1